MSSQGVRRKSNSEIESRLSALETKNKLQIKYLQSPVTSSQQLPDLTFNNLIPGRLYVAKMVMRVGLTSGQQATLTATHDGSQIGRIRQEDTGSTDTQHVYGETIPFVATTNTVTFDFGTSGGTGATLEGDGTSGATHTILKELNNSELTTDFT